MCDSFLPFTKPTIDEETIDSVVQVLRSGQLTNGPQVIQFEKQLSDYLAGRAVRTFNSGTSALQIALRILRIEQGDEIITTPLSWIATAHSIVINHGTPVFVDIDPQTRNLDLNQVEQAITSRTKVILPVHLAGLPVDMDRLYQIANKYQLRVVEDAAQAFGSLWNGKPIGSFGDLVVFSFQANKNLTTAEGGALVLNNQQEVEQAEIYRMQGIQYHHKQPYDVISLSAKFNMNDICATIGIGQLKQIDQNNQLRKQLAQHYFHCFGQDFEDKYQVQLPIYDMNNTNWHMFQIVLPQQQKQIHSIRTNFIQHMKQQGIGVGIHYPPIHLFTFYQQQFPSKSNMFPIAERVGQLIVTLPLFPTMTFQHVQRVVDAIRLFFDTNKK